jgi:hypothetical protein
MIKPKQGAAAYVRDVIGPIQGVGITLVNWRNETFQSWLMD